MARVAITPRHNAQGEPQGFLQISTDLSQENRRFHALASTQLYTRSLFESNPDALMITDLLGIITDLNQQMEQLTGLTRAALIGMPFKQVCTDPLRAEAGIRQALQTGQVRHYPLTVQAQDGRLIEISYSASSLLDADGKLLGMLAIARDITEHLRLQAQLAEVQTYTRGLIEASSDGLVTVNESMHITDVNETLCRMVGRPRSQLVGSSFPAYFSDPQLAMAGVRLTFKQELVTNYELNLLAANRQQTHVSFSASIYRDISGNVRGIFASTRDITEQKQLEQRLRDLQLYTRSLIESNIDALMTTDPLGIITDLNQPMELLTGCTRLELIGSTFKEYFTDPQRAETGIKEVLREGKVTDFELTAQSKTGEQTVVSYNATTFYDQQGRLQGVFAAARDITERKRYDLALQEKNTELERANLAKDRFLASMSHELRTPLNAIIGFTGTLLMKLAGPLTTDQGKQLKTIQSSAWHLLAIINDMLDLATIESGKIELNIEAVVLQELLQEVHNTLQPGAQQKQLSFTLEVPETELSLQTDRRSLKQILLNLVNNALKFTEQGSVILRLERLQQADQHGIALRVIDTGIGIQASEQDKLFQAFERIAGKEGLRIEGTGLGLHVSQKLAHLLDGSIVVESEYGRGSTFSLLLKDL